MNISATRFFVLAALVGIGGGACTPAATSSAGTGGKPAGTGGASTGSGGSSTGSGGASTGSGGSSTGSGGASTGSGGAAGPTDGGVSPASFAYTFDTTVQGFGMNGYVPTAPQKNLAAPDSGSAPTLVHDATAGEPTPGSLKLTASFTDYRQFVDVVIGPQPALNLAGKTIHAKVRLASGTFSNGPGATLHVGTGTGYVYAGGTYTSLTAGTWTDLTLDLTKVTAAMFDATMVVQIGIQFYSGDPGEAGAFPGPLDVVIQIDSITDGTGTTPTTPAGVAYNFDTAAQGFAYNSYVSTTTTNLAAPDSGSAPTLVHDATQGSPTMGSLKASVTFTGFKQFVDIVIGPNPALNLMGKTLHAKVRLTSGTFGEGAGVTLHAGTGTGYVYGAGAYTPLVLGAWTDLTLDLATVTAAMWDPSMVVQLGLQFYSGDPPEAGAFVGPNDVVFHIDSITE